MTIEQEFETKLKQALVNKTGVLNVVIEFLETLGYYKLAAIIKLTG